MKFKYAGHIFLTPGFSPKTNTVTTSRGEYTFTAVGVDAAHPEQAIAVAQDLVAQGCQMIELCGGFGPHWISRVQEELGSEIPVGGVFYGPEYRETLAALFR